MTPSTPLVGRRRELAAVTASLHGLGRAARFVAVSGEPGIGKTRLLDELGARGEERGCVVLTGRGAGQPLQQGAHGAVGAVALVLEGGRRGCALRADRREHARELRDAVAEHPLQALGAEARRVVVERVDPDAEREVALELVAHLLRRPPRAQLVLAVTYRTGGLPAPVLAAFEAAGRDGMVVDVALAPLSSAEADALLGEGLSR